MRIFERRVNLRFYIPALLGVAVFLVVWVLVPLISVFGRSNKAGIEEKTLAFLMLGLLVIMTGVLYVIRKGDFKGIESSRHHPESTERT